MKSKRDKKRQKRKSEKFYDKMRRRGIIRVVELPKAEDWT